MGAHFRNWAGNVRAELAERVVLHTEQQAVALVQRARGAGLALKAVGAGHSWSDAASTRGIQLSLDGYKGLVRVDPEAGVCIVRGGTRLRELTAMLRRYNLSLPCLGSISEQSVAGATATGTHGSGLAVGNLSSGIVSMRLVDGRGETHALTRGSDSELFAAARVGLGALGVVTELGLRCEPLFNLEEQCEPMQFERALHVIEQRLREHEYVKLWWLPHTGQAEIYCADRTSAPPTHKPWLRRFEESALSRWLVAGALRAGRARPAWIPSINRQVAGTLFRRTRRVDRADRVFNVPQVPVHREAEYGVALEYGVAAMHGLHELIRRESIPVNFIVEMRFVAADDIWLSSAYERQSCQVGAYMFDTPGIERYFEAFEETMLKMGGRPHWGKEFSASSTLLREQFPRLADFDALRRRLDPDGVFVNSFVERVFGLSQP